MGHAGKLAPLAREEKRRPSLAVGEPAPHATGAGATLDRGQAIDQRVGRVGAHGNPLREVSAIGRGRRTQGGEGGVGIRRGSTRQQRRSIAARQHTERARRPGGQQEESMVRPCGRRPSRTRRPTG